MKADEDTEMGNEGEGGISVGARVAEDLALLLAFFLLLECGRGGTGEDIWKC